MLKIPPFDWLRVVSEAEPPEAEEKETGGEAFKSQFHYGLKVFIFGSSPKELLKNRFSKTFIPVCAILYALCP